MMNGKCCGVHKLGWALVIIGALNWGLIGVAKFNLVMALLGQWPMVERVVYVIVGLAGIAVLMQKSCKGCSGCMTEGGMMEKK